MHYNGLGQRVRQKVSGVWTDYLLDVQSSLWKVIAADDGSTDRFIHDPMGIAQHEDNLGNWHWMAKDGLGTVRGVYDDTLTEVYAADRDPYGDLIASTGTNPTPFEYTGEPEDQNGLLHLRARYYDPTQAVFNSLDPVEMANRYAYVGGDPVNNADPSGLLTWGDLAIANKFAGCSGGSFNPPNTPPPGIFIPPVFSGLGGGFGLGGVPGPGGVFDNFQTVDCSAVEADTAWVRSNLERYDVAIDNVCQWEVPGEWTAKEKLLTVYSVVTRMASKLDELATQLVGIPPGDFTGMFKLIIGDMRLIYEPPTAENHGYVNGTYVATDCGGVGCGYFAKTSKYGTMEISYIGMKGTANIPFFRLLMHEFSHMINYRWTVDGTTAPETYYNKLGPTGTEFESGEDGFMEGIHNMRSGDWAYEWVTDAIAFWFMGLFESDVSGVIREKQIQDMMARILWTAIQP